MATTTANTDAPRAGKEDAGKPAPEGEGEAKPAAKSGGKLGAFLPLIVTVVAMPVLAYVTTSFVLLPKIKAAIAKANPGMADSAAPADAPAPAEAAGKDADKDAGKDAAKDPKDPKISSGKGKINVPIPKILVNVAGTMGTRYLMTSLTLVGNNSDFKNKIDDNIDQLKDLATSVLSAKTIADLEKPGARNVIRAELTTVFNQALGGPLVQEIYITEMAIQ